MSIKVINYKKKHYLWHIFLVILTITIVPALVATYKKRTNPLLRDISKLPKKIRKVIDIKNMPKKNLALINIKDGNINYSSNFSDEYANDKLIPILKSVIRVMKSNNRIPDGYYFIATVDGVHKEYSWPLLSFASDADLVAKKKVILIPDFEAHKGYTTLFNTIDYAINKYPWPQKKPYIFWRGSPTGDEFSKDPFATPRLMFMKIISNGSYEYVNAGFTGYFSGGKHQKKLYPYLKKLFHLAEPVNPSSSLAYKYLLDIDGHSCSYSRMAWILTSNSLLFKVESNKVQWYYSQLLPYTHYVPIKQDFSDLSTQYEWAEANQDKVQVIIKNARYLADKLFNQEAIDLATRKAFVDYYELTQQ